MLGGCLGLAGKWMMIAAKQAKTNPASKYIKMLIRFLMNWLCPGSKIGQSEISSFSITKMSRIENKKLDNTYSHI